MNIYWSYEGQTVETPSPCLKKVINFTSHGYLYKYLGVYLCVCASMCGFHTSLKIPVAMALLCALLIDVPLEEEKNENYSTRIRFVCYNSGIIHV